MKKYVILLFCVLLITTTHVTAQKDLSLDEAISIALQRNSALVKSKNYLEGNAADVKSAYGNLIPTLGVEGSWQWDRLQNPDQATDSRLYNLSAGGSVVLFNGLANYANISSAKRGEEAAEFNIDKQKRDIVQNTKILYYSILRSKALLKVRDENLAYNQKLLETISERNRLGSAPVADLYAQQVQTGGAEVEVIRAQNQVDDAQNTLIDYLSLDVLEEYNFVSKIDTVNESNIEEYSRDFSGINLMVDYALENRTDYMAQQRIVEGADKSITVAQGGYWPMITGNYGITKRDDQIDGVLEWDFANWGVGLGLSFPIFSQFNTQTSVQYAKINLLNAEEDYRALKRQIKIEIKQGYLDFLAVKKALDVALVTVQSASENRRVQYERYSLGSGTFLEVLQADRDYQDALSLRIDAEFNFHSAREALLNSLGKLEYKPYENNSDEGE